MKIDVPVLSSLSQSEFEKGFNDSFHSLVNDTEPPRQGAEWQDADAAYRLGYSAGVHAYSDMRRAAI